jgi:hypothetical protein
MKIFRYNNRPSRQRGSYQHKVVTLLQDPWDYPEWKDHAKEVGDHELENWYFGFTRIQLKEANLQAKEACGEYFEWGDSKLISFEVPDESCLMLSDQVVFYAPMANISIEQIK